MFANERKVRKFKVARQEEPNQWVSLAFFFFADCVDLTGIAGHALMNHGREERTDHLPIFYKTMLERI